MSRLTDLAAIRAILDTDRGWSVYPLGDLAVQRRPHCTWLYSCGTDPGLVLLYREFATPIVFALGRPDRVQPLLEEASDEKELYLHLRPEIVDLLRPGYRIEDEVDMWRMVLDPAQFKDAGSANAVCLGPGHLEALEQLYLDGRSAGETPHFFFPSMIADGAFFGIWEGGALVAAGGTHLVEPGEGVAALGNIYTRRDRRGRGLATQITQAITAELLRRQVRTIALNVSQSNHAAIRVYERLGFRRHGAYKEALARKAPAAP